MLHPVTRAVLGLIDVESERVHAFTQDDRAFLEKCASSLNRLWDKTPQGRSPLMTDEARGDAEPDGEPRI
jgi:hypothetical protein